MKIIGRENAIEILERIYHSSKAEFLALYGRRRVGKTYLVKEFFSKKQKSNPAPLFFYFTALKDGRNSEQLFFFKKELEGVFYHYPLPELKRWIDAFELLTLAIHKFLETPSNRSRPIVLFFDEFPWAARAKSGLAQALDHYWNRHWSHLKNIKLIICGSAASWMINNLIRAKGGLHNRLTEVLRLQPFTIEEVSRYLKELQLHYNAQSLVDIYLCLGGVPYYLNFLRRGKSAAQNISQICFGKDAPLAGEFENLLHSLYDNSEIHYKIIQILSTRKSGMSRNEILKKIKLNSGGQISKCLSELEEASFIASFIPLGKKKKDIFFKIVDQYTLFYLSWIDKSSHNILDHASASKYWSQMVSSPGYYAWSGLAFEIFCFNNLHLIRQQLGIEEIACKVGAWKYVPSAKNKESGAQIDLVFDREDKTITLCEIKYSLSPYQTDKQEILGLHQKIATFKQVTNTKKQILFALITLHGAKPSIFLDEVVTNYVQLDQALEKINR
ncbi:MAG: AAA family ATPase [Oligoflexia bacterium]|nr:AAA family ATPase [Oligoflexia bacterium]MBF0365413.1 AAA family ATPase [Oligoflexia bacterium]